MKWLDSLRGHRTWLATLPVLWGLLGKTMMLSNGNFVEALSVWGTILVLYGAGYGMSKTSDGIREHLFQRAQNNLEENTE